MHHRSVLWLLLMSSFLLWTLSPGLWPQETRMSGMDFPSVWVSPEQTLEFLADLKKPAALRTRCLAAALDAMDSRVRRMALHSLRDDPRPYIRERLLDTLIRENDPDLFFELGQALTLKPLEGAAWRVFVESVYRRLGRESQASRNLFYRLESVSPRSRRFVSALHSAASDTNSGLGREPGNDGTLVVLHKEFLLRSPPDGPEDSLLLGYTLGPSPESPPEAEVLEIDGRQIQLTSGASNVAHQGLQVVQIPKEVATPVDGRIRIRRSGESRREVRIHGLVRPPGEVDLHVSPRRQVLDTRDPNVIQVIEGCHLSRDIASHGLILDGELCRFILVLPMTTGLLSSITFDHDVLGDGTSTLDLSVGGRWAGRFITQPMTRSARIQLPLLPGNTRELPVEIRFTTGKTSMRIESFRLEVLP